MLVSSIKPLLIEMVLRFLRNNAHADLISRAEFTALTSGWSLQDHWTKTPYRVAVFNNFYFSPSRQSNRYVLLFPSSDKKHSVIFHTANAQTSKQFAFNNDVSRGKITSNSPTHVFFKISERLSTKLSLSVKIFPSSVQWFVIFPPLYADLARKQK